MVEARHLERKDSNRRKTKKGKKENSYMCGGGEKVNK